MLSTLFLNWFAIETDILNSLAYLKLNHIKCEYFVTHENKYIIFIRVSQLLCDNGVTELYKRGFPDAF